MKKEKTQIEDTICFLARLKRDVESAFIEYRSSLSSKRPLGKLASYFAIPIDLTRLEDYYVRKFESEPLTVTIADKKTDTVYHGSYTYHTKLLPPGLSAGLHLETFSYKGAVQTQNLYRVLDAEKTSFEPLTSELIITHKDRALVFEKYHTDGINQTTGSRPFKISLEGSLPTYADISKRQPLYSKTMTSTSCRTKGGLREETTISPTTQSIWQRINVPKNQKLYYTINRVTENSHIFGYIRDIDRNDSTEEQTQMHLIHLIEIDSKSNRFTNSLDVYKKNDVLQINCQVGVIPFSYESFNVTKGPLTSIELGDIIENLHATFIDQEFIQAVILELQEFGYKLCLHRGFESAPNYMPVPERFADLSFAQIEDMIITDIDAYFKEAEEEYRNTRGRLSGQDPAFSHQMKPIE